MPEARFSLSGKRVYVAGHRGMVGQALARALRARGIEPIIATRAEVDLENQAQTECWFAEHRPQVVLLAAAHVGGILANNTYPRDFLYKNVMIAANVIEAAHRNGVEKLVNLGSSCIYPKFAEQPIREESLLTGSLEPTNEWYAIAKIAAIKLAQSYRRQFGADMISLMPSNLYGPATITTPSTAMCCQRSSAASMRRRRLARRLSRFGVAAPPGANSCSWMISRRARCSLPNIIPASRISMLVRVRI